MSFKQRIWMLPAIAFVLFTIGTGITMMQSISLASRIERIGTAEYPALDKISSLKVMHDGIVQELQSAVAEGDKKRLESVEQRAAAARKLINEWGKIEGAAKAAGKVQGSLDAYVSAATAAAKAMLGEGTGDASQLIPAMQKTQKLHEAALKEASDTASAAFNGSLAGSAATVRQGLWINLVLALAVIGGLAVASWFVIRSVWADLGGEPAYVRGVVARVAAGDLSQSVDIGKSDKASLLAAVRDMTQSLSKVIADVRTSVDSVTTASGEIAQGNRDLSARTESQASSLQQTAASVEELTSTVKQSADNARQAQQLAASASEVAAKGGSVVGEVVTTMDGITRSSKKITDIIGVIDGIAFQTNILALNAAVEAARAGEQGRGFAVVAAEVRTLAQRSAQAAKEIKTLISDSVAKVNDGTKLVAEAGSTMEDIVAQVKRVTDLMSEITSATIEQSGGIEQVNRAVISLDQTTQQNAALVEESAAAAASLKEQAARLNQAVGVFKLAA